MNIFWYAGQLILTLSKIIKIVATSCQILRLKCTKFDFGWSSAPDQGCLQCSPDFLAVSKGSPRNVTLMILTPPQSKNISGAPGIEFRA